MSQNNLTEIKNRLLFLIKRTNNLYIKYKENKIYANALLINQTNKEIINLLYNYGYMFPNNDATNKVIDHFAIWLIQFRDKENSTNCLDEKFIFPTLAYSIPYPKVEISELLS